MTNRHQWKQLMNNYVSNGEPLAQSVLNDIFGDWVKGHTDDQELVSALLPLKEQPLLLRLQILAQAVNLGQCLLQEASAHIGKEERAIVNSMEQLDEAYEQSPGADIEAAQEALQLYLHALHSLQEGLGDPEPHHILDSLNLGQEAAVRLNEACRSGN